MMKLKGVVQTRANLQTVTLEIPTVSDDSTPYRVVISFVSPHPEFEQGDVWEIDLKKVPSIHA